MRRALRSMLERSRALKVAAPELHNDAAIRTTRTAGSVSRCKCGCQSSISKQRRVREARLAVRSPGDPIRVVYCIDNMQVGGTELNAVRTAERLDRRRFAVSVVCIRESGPMMARYRQARIPVHTFPMRSFFGAESVRQAVRLIRLFRDEGTEVVHSHDAYTSVYGTMCAR